MNRIFTSLDVIVLLIAALSEITNHFTHPIKDKDGSWVVFCFLSESASRNRK